MLGEKLVKGKKQYSVRWKGYSKKDDTWENEHDSPGGAWQCSWGEMPVVRRWHRLKTEERAMRQAKASVKCPPTVSGPVAVGSSSKEDEASTEEVVVLEAMEAEAVEENENCEAGQAEEMDVDDEDKQGEDEDSDDVVDDSDGEDDEDDELKAMTAEERRAVRDAVDKEEKDEIALAAKAVQAAEAAAEAQGEIAALPFSIRFALEASGEVRLPPLFKPARLLRHSPAAEAEARLPCRFRRRTRASSPKMRTVPRSSRR